MRIANNATASTTPVSGTWGTDARHIYSKQQAWSSDQSLFLLDNPVGALPVLSCSTAATSARPTAAARASRAGIIAGTPDPAHPHELIGVPSSGRELYWYGVTACTKTRSWTLPITVSGFDSGEGNPSESGRFIALGHADSMFVLGMNSYPTTRVGRRCAIPPCSLNVVQPTTSRDIDWVSIPPSGRYVVIQYVGTSSADYGMVGVFDVDTTTLTITGPHTMAPSSPRASGYAARSNGWILNFNHMDMAANPYSGTDVRVGGAEGGTYSGRPVRIPLDTGALAPLTKGSHEAYLWHASCRNVSRPGWAYLTYYKEDGKTLSDEVVAVRLDGSGSVERLCHTHSAASSCYRCQAHASPSPDGQHVVFASNWAQDCGSGCGSATDIKDYIVRVSPQSDVTPPARIQDLRSVE